MLEFVARYILAVALANTPGTVVQETECGRAFEPDSDAYHECVCVLSTWQCEIQGWCTDPEFGPPSIEPGHPYRLPALPRWSLGQEEGCE